MQYQRKLAGFPEVCAERLKQTPSKRTGSAAAPTSAQPAKHSRPSCTVCGNGLIAMAAFICPNDSSKSAAAGGEEAQSDLLVVTKANHNSTDQRSLNGPISPLKGESMPVSCSDQLIVGFSRLALMTLKLDACCIMTPSLGLSCVSLPLQFQMCSDSLLIVSRCGCREEQWGGSQWADIPFPSAKAGRAAGGGPGRHLRLRAACEGPAQGGLGP